MDHEDKEDIFFRVNILEILNTLFKNKIKIILISFCFAVFSVFYALSIPNKYISYSVLLPNNESSSLSSLARQYSGFASIAGIDIGGSGQSLTASELAEEQLKSLSFFEKYLYEKILVELMAGSEWDKNNDKLLIDNSLYDEKNSKWVRDIKWPLTQKPSPQEAHIIFLSHISSELEKRSSKLTLKVEHVHPSTAKKWLDLIIEGFQDDNKQRNISIARKSIIFLEDEYKKTNIAELKRIISNLLGESIQRLSVSSIEGDNLFLVVQEPFVPLVKSSPNRAIICIVISVIGFIFSCLLFLITNLLQERKTSIKKFFKDITS